jgi:hypothetical protein
VLSVYPLSAKRLYVACNITRHVRSLSCETENIWLQIYVGIQSMTDYRTRPSTLLEKLLVAQVLTKFLQNPTNVKLYSIPSREIIYLFTVYLTMSVAQSMYHQTADAEIPMYDQVP